MQHCNPGVRKFLLEPMAELPSKTNAFGSVIFFFIEDFYFMIFPSLFFLLRKVKEGKKKKYKCKKQ